MRDPTTLQHGRRSVRRRFVRGVLGTVLAAAALLALLWFANDAGLRKGEESVGALESRIASLEADNRSASGAANEARAALQSALRDADMWRRRYEDEVPRGRSADLWQLVERKLGEGVGIDRLIGVIGLATNERECDEQVITKRIIVKTRLHGGSDTAAGFGNGRITVLGDGQSARDSDQNLLAWYDHNRPVVISFVTFGGETEKVEGYLPLHHAVLVDQDEFRFTIAEGERSFASVIAQRCDYP